MPNASVVTRFSPPDIEEIAHGEGEQDKPARHLKICHRDPERLENKFPKKHEPDGNAERGDNAKNCFLLPSLRIDVRAQADEDRDHSDRVDRDENRNEGNEEFGGELFHRESARRRTQKNEFTG